MPASVALLAITAEDINVVITSITLVFAMLLALCLIVSFEGKIFNSSRSPRNKEKKRQMDAVQSAISAAPTVGSESISAPAEQASQGTVITAGSSAPDPAPDGAIPSEIVAVIAAAVYDLVGEKTVIRSIHRLPGTNPNRRGAWGDAGVAANVRPF